MVHAAFVPDESWGDTLEPARIYMAWAKCCTWVGCLMRAIINCYSWSVLRFTNKSFRKQQYHSDPWLLRHGLELRQWEITTKSCCVSEWLESYTTDGAFPVEVHEFDKGKIAGVTTTGRHQYSTSHPTVGAQQIFLSSSHEELKISPETWLWKHSLAHPDQTFQCVTPKTNIPVKQL